MGHPVCCLHLLLQLNIKTFLCLDEIDCNIVLFKDGISDYSVMHCCCFQVLFMHIASVDKLPLTTTGSPLHIRCKMFLSVTFVIPRERDCHEVYTNLQQLSQPGMPAKPRQIPAQLS
jgi:hypothetical protein